MQPRTKASKCVLNTIKGPLRVTSLFFQVSRKSKSLGSPYPLFDRDRDFAHQTRPPCVRVRHTDEEPLGYLYMQAGLPGPYQLLRRMTPK